MFIIFFFIFGAIFGSFINCLVYRLHTKKTILGRSFCPKCQHTLKFFDLFPLFSYVFLGGKCRYCQKKISWQYFLVELIMGLVFSLGYWFYFLSNLTNIDNFLSLVFYLLIIIFLAIIFLYDLKYYLVLDIIVWPAIIIAFLFNFLILKISLVNLLIAGAVAVLFFGLQFLISRGKWIGGGDILIGLLVGFIVGWPKIIIVLFMAYILGSLVGIILLIFKKKKISSKIPFGPFLVFSTWLTILFGNSILNWYLKGILGF